MLRTMKLTVNPVEETVRAIEQVLLEIEEMVERLAEETIVIAEIAAPPFEETQRAEYVRDRFLQMGYDARIDTVGNVVAARKLPIVASSLVVSAHLDTVFPESVDVTVRREGTKLFGPGIGDDSRGLAVMLLIAGLLKKPDLRCPLLFVATVGEEGIGDLRGVKHLFSSDEHADLPKPMGFITIDGSGSHVVATESVGSLRYKVHFRGPGGHSYGSFGIVNPSFAMGSALAALGKLTVPSCPNTTFSVGRVGGGTSVNSIPEHVWAEVDLRSVDADELKKLDSKFKLGCENSLREEQERRKGDLSLELEMIGNRPVGKTDEESALVKSVVAANEHFDLNTEFLAMSTDASVPQSMGIPAICVASVDVGGGAHTLGEWIEAGRSSLLPVRRNLLLIALFALRLPSAQK